MNIGIYGGTFNPPHLGHVRVMEAVMTQLQLDRLLLIPTGTPPHKTLPQGSPSPQMRRDMISMVGQTVMDSRRRLGMHSCVVEVSDLEIERQGQSYTVDTLTLLKEQYPEDKLYLIMGEDMLLSFFSWVSPEKIVKMVDICGFLRNDQAPSPELLAQGEKVREELGGTVSLITVPRNIAVDSTSLRKDLAELGPWEQLTDVMLPCTIGQVIWNKLYGVDLSLKELELPFLRYLVWGEVKPQRIPHIMGVEMECGTLAARWGVDEEVARRAGVLHDYSKYWTHQQHLDFCRKYHVELDELEEVTEKLLHAKSGAGFARHILGESEEICEAIDCHTTGKGNMSTLDKILYVADYMEPQRTFEEVEEMRYLAYCNLDKALAFGLRLSVEEMKARGKVTHKNTLEAYEQYGSYCR